MSGRHRPAECAFEARDLLAQVGDLLEYGRLRGCDGADDHVGEGVRPRHCRSQMTQDSIDELVARFHAILTTVGIDAS